MCRGSCSPGKSTTLRGKSGMRSGRMGPMGNDTRGREKWRVRGNRAVVGKLVSSPDGVGTAHRQARAQCVTDVVERRSGKDRLEVCVVGITALGNAASENRKIEWIAPERIRVDGELVVSGGTNKQVGFLALVVDRHAVDRGLVGCAEAEKQGQAVQSVKAQRICLDRIFVDEGLGRRVVAQIHFQAQLLQAKALHEIIDLMLLLALYILGGITRNGGAGPVVETHAVSSNQQAGVEIDFDDALDAALIEVDVLARGYRHEGVWGEAFMVYAGLQLPFLPTIVVFRDSQAKGCGRLGALEDLVAILASKESRQKSMVRLADRHHGVALLLENHESPLVRSRKNRCEILSLSWRVGSSVTPGRGGLAKRQDFDKRARSRWRLWQSRKLCRSAKLAGAEDPGWV